jgi:iron complex transport system substrate-binding protein
LQIVRNNSEGNVIKRHWQMALFGAILLALSVGSVLGFGTSAAQGNPTPTPSATLTGTPARTVYPLTIEHELGQTTIAAAPQRIAVLDYSFLDALLSLQVDPKLIGATIDAAGGDRGAPPYLQTYIADVTSVGARPQPNLETLAVFKPDLIIADEFAQKDLYPELSRIAPTIVYNSRLGTFDDLIAQFLEIGRILDKADLAQETYVALQTLLADAQKQSKADAPAIVPVVATARTVTAHSKTSFVGSLLERLGRVNGVEPQADASQFEVSFEGFVALAPARVVVFTGVDETPVIREWSKNPLWEKLQAVTDGRVYEFDRDLWTRGRGVLALNLIIGQAISSGLLADAPPAEGYRFKSQ